ncbi:MAG: DUF5615 family PIN-like protein [Nitrospirae bacterium]|nr:DUF5615 family PIN-like protein [Nitrospirota bacterium]
MQQKLFPRNISLRFLVDENLPFGIVEFLSSFKHDVFDVAASNIRGSSDNILWAKAAKERSIIVTRDLDYPIPKLRPAPFGVILIRVPSDFKAALITSIFIDSVKKIKFENLKNKIVVISPGRIRISPLP